MSEKAHVLINYDNCVATITLNRPQRGNSLTPNMVQQLIDAFEKIKDNKDIRVVVLTGSGKYFCTGMDLTPTNQSEMGDRLKDGSAPVQALNLFKTISDCPKPVIAKVNGPAMGGGWGLVFTADIILVAKSAFFQFSEVKRGIVPAIISAVVTPQLGLAKTKQLMITGRRISAEEGYALGFITALADSGEHLDKLTHEFVTGLLENGPEAMRRTKDLVKFVAMHSPEENMAKVKEVFAATVQSEEALYGMTCFMQRQKPDWSKFYAERAKL